MTSPNTTAQIMSGRPSGTSGRVLSRVKDEDPTDDPTDPGFTLEVGEPPEEEDAPPS